MIAGRWNRMKSIFETAIELDPPARGSFLDRSCLEDDELRREIEGLLVAHDRAGEFLVAPPAWAGEETTEAAPDAHARGKRFGSYIALREIGWGGMGVVYLAARADREYEQHVALKVLKRGMDSDEILRRFRNERQILAALDHPCVAKLFDGGTSDDGLPYFVMEHIEGTPIDRHCDRHRLSIDERLRMFRDVCSAVHYAHQNMVIHRDIKPRNILVSPDGVPKLLDFGIAKLLGPHVAPWTQASTAAGLRPMTLDYASPEQVSGGRISTATDVYSLGVLLYKLLTGHHPHRLKARRTSDMARVICETETERPSAIVTRVEPASTEDDAPAISPESVSRDRRTRADRLRRRLSGDLDTIVLMAMRKEPERRYASVEQFSEDIRRHLEGLPVIARKDTFSYRSGKFLRRHRVGAFAAALVALALVGGIVAATWQGARAREQARVASQERDRATREGDKAKRINRFLQEVLAAAHPSKMGPEVKVLEALDESARTAEENFAEHPETLAQVWLTIGRTYCFLGRAETGERLLRSALEVCRDLGGDSDPETVTALAALAECTLFRGDLEGAEELLRTAVAAVQSSNSGSSEQAGDVNNLLGWTLNERGQVAASGEHYREALAIYRRVLGEGHQKVAFVLNNLAVMKSYEGDLDTTMELYRQAIAILRHVPGRESRGNLATNLQNLGVTHLLRGEFVEAQPLIEEAVGVREEILGEKHPWVAIARAHLGDLFCRRGEYDRAEREAKLALEIQRASLPEGHVDLARSLIVLGTTLTRKGDATAAEPYLLEALAVRKAALAEGHALVALARASVAECLTHQRRYGEAERLLEHSLGDLASGLGPNDPRTVDVLRLTTDLYSAWDKPDKAAHYRAMLP